MYDNEQLTVHLKNSLKGIKVMCLACGDVALETE